MMFFRQYYLACLSHASYLIGDTGTGRAVVVDPQRDVAQYVADAEANGLHIERIFETHFHADFLSGHLELQKVTGADITFGVVGADRTEFPVVAMKDGERLSLGAVILEVRDTPGHTPESISIVVYDGSDTPYGVLTGDTLFIGDVGRPDLLSAFGASAEDLGRQLYHSLHHKLLTLPDTTKVYPAHGAGSACGKNLSTETVSTIGEQLRTNYALAPMSEDEFVKVVSEGQAAAPLYFSFAAVRNRLKRDVFDESTGTTMLTIDEVFRAQQEGAVIIDTREPAEFALGHLKGSINVGLSGRFAEYSGEVVTSETPIVLVCPAGTEDEARIRLGRIGFDKVLGALDAPEVAFVNNPDSVVQASRLTVEQLRERREALSNVQVIDVRGPGETEAGVIPGAQLIQLPQLVTRLGDLDPQAPTVVYCAGGYRSSIAASTLRQRGFVDVSDIIGGFGAWQSAGADVSVPQRTH
jgi:glyoxylase-like metal-dependent hydrolase (beta-lactamase superfamily II)/rhodanese-related sulfurtransferase